MNIQLDGVILTHKFTGAVLRDGQEFEVEYRLMPTMHRRWDVTCHQLDRNGVPLRSVVIFARAPSTRVADAEVGHMNAEGAYVTRPTSAIWKLLEETAREFATALRGETQE